VKVITVSRSASGTSSWLADGDYTLVTARWTSGGAAGSALLTENPTATIAQLNATTKVYYEHILFTSISTATNSSQPVQLNIPIYSGRTYFVVTDQAGCFQLFIEPIVT
jgi:hypothetical protein